MLSLSQLHQIAGGLNIEGGDPYHYLLKDNPNRSCLWANVILVVYRPFHDNIIVDDKYPMLENSIGEINEHQFLATFLMITLYYIREGERLLGEQPNINIHFHQDKNTVGALIDEFDRLLRTVSDYNRIIYSADTPIYATTKPDYKDVDILISFSQCAGLDERFTAGTLLLGESFIPYDIDDKMIDMMKRDYVLNDLTFRLDDMIQSEYNRQMVCHVNQSYKSKNPNKKSYIAKLITKEDFIETPILKVNKLWNPVDPNERVKVHFIE